jgi:hypothetical protein
MMVAFGICVIGLLGGMFYYLFVVIVLHRTLESVLGNSIWFYKALGGIGILGFVLFVAFLFSLMAGGKSERPGK